MINILTEENELRFFFQFYAVSRLKSFQTSRNVNLVIQLARNFFSTFFLFLQFKSMLPT